MNIKQIVIGMMVAVASFAAAGLVPQTTYAAPADSKAECKKIDGYYEGSGKTATCNANITQKECNKYGGTFNIGKAGTNLACIIKKGAKADTGTTCSDNGCDTNENIKNTPVDQNTQTVSSDPLDNPVAGNDCGGVKTSIIKCSQDNSDKTVEDNGIWGLLLIALNILTAGVGILAVGGIVYGAILYTTAEDKADQVKQATGIITNVVIGLVLFALMWAGLNFIVPGGVFA